MPTQSSIPSSQGATEEVKIEEKVEEKQPEKEHISFWNPRIFWEGQLIRAAYKPSVLPSEETKTQPRKYRDRSKYHFADGKVVNVRES